MYFTSEYADVQYLADKNKVLLTWKKEAKLDNYRKPTTAALELLREHNLILSLMQETALRTKKKT